MHFINKLEMYAVTKQTAFTNFAMQSTCS